MKPPEERPFHAAAKRFATVEVPFLAIVSAFATFLPIISWPYWLSTAGLGTMTTLLWAWRGEERVHIPSDVLGGGDVDEEVILEVPGSHDMLVAANSHVKNIYRHDALSLVEVERWWGRNPWIFGALRSNSGEYLGYFDILPLTNEGVRFVESGDFEEREIGAHHILPPSKMAKAKKLYLSGIAVRDQRSDIGRTRAAKLISGLAAYIHHYYGPKLRRVIATAATDDGRRLLVGVGGKVICEARSRKDKHDLFEVVVTPNLFLSVKSRAKKRGKPPRLSFKSPK